MTASSPHISPAKSWDCIAITVGRPGRYLSEPRLEPAPGGLDEAELNVEVAARAEAHRNIFAF